MPEKVSLNSFLGAELEVSRQFNICCYSTAARSAWHLAGRAASSSPVVSVQSTGDPLLPLGRRRSRTELLQLCTLLYSGVIR